METGRDQLGNPWTQWRCKVVVARKSREVENESPESFGGKSWLHSVFVESCFLELVSRSLVTDGACSEEEAVDNKFRFQAEKRLAHRYWICQT